MPEPWSVIADDLGGVIVEKSWATGDVEFTIRCYCRKIFGASPELSFHLGHCFV